MRTWQYDEPDYNDEKVVITKTDEEIIAEYYDYWKMQMVRIGKQTEINHENCIQDWVTLNWAREVKDKDNAN